MVCSFVCFPVRSSGCYRRRARYEHDEILPTSEAAMLSGDPAAHPSISMMTERGGLAA